MHTLQASAPQPAAYPAALARETITGCVLAGGRGMRIGGVDKGLQALAGRPLVQHVAARLAPQVSGLVLNANRHLDLYRSFGWPVVSDADSEFAGPLAGMAAALAQCPTEWMATAPCDAPSLPPDLVARLAQAAAAQGAAVALAATPRLEGAGGEAGALQPQPVFCLLHRRLLQPLRQYLAEGGRKIDAFTAAQGQVLVPFADEAGFANANSPQELERLAAVLQGAGAGAEAAALPALDDFRARALAAGFDEVLERHWAPGTVLATHTHDFGVDALLVQGEMWLGMDGATRRMLPGDRFTLEAMVPHDERYGAAGATYWVARRNPRPAAAT